MRHVPAPTLPLSRRCTPLAVAAALLPLGLAAGCVHTPPPSNGVYSSPPRLYSADDTGSSQPIADSQPVRSGQVFAVLLNLEQPAHVYVIHRRGMILEGLYPGLNAADSELGAGPQRLPGSESWMRAPTLDKQSRLCVLLSAEPLAPAQRRCLNPNSGQRPAPFVQTFQLAPSRIP